MDSNLWLLIEEIDPREQPLLYGVLAVGLPVLRLGPLVAPYVAKFAELLDDLRPDRAKLLRAGVDIAQELDDLQTQVPGLRRVSVLFAERDGDTWRVTMQDVAPPDEALRDRWNAHEATADYVAAVVEPMLAPGYDAHHIRADRLLPGSSLRTEYESAQIAGSDVYLLHVAGSRYWFLSIGHAEGVVETALDRRAKLRTRDRVARLLGG
jgi:hypothetical protein